MNWSPRLLLAMEYNISITLSEGEDLISRLKQEGLNPTGPLSLTLSKKHEAKQEKVVVKTPTPVAPVKRGRGRPRKVLPTEAVSVLRSVKKTTPKVKKTKKKAKRGRPTKAKPWTKKEEIWVARQPKPTESGGIEVLFKKQFGVARTNKSITAKWRRLHGQQK